MPFIGEQMAKKGTLPLQPGKKNGTRRACGQTKNLKGKGGWQKWKGRETEVGGKGVFQQSKKGGTKKGHMDKKSYDNSKCESTRVKRRRSWGGRDFGKLICQNLARISATWRKRNKQKKAGT